MPETKASSFSQSKINAAVHMKQVDRAWISNLQKLDINLCCYSSKVGAFPAVIFKSF